MAGSVLVLAEEAVRQPEKPEPVLKYDPEFPDEMVVATVNSEPITVGELLEPYANHLETQVRPQVPDEIYRQVRQEWTKRLLPDVIDRKLRAQGLLADLTERQRKALEKYLDERWAEYTVELRRKLEVSTMEELADAIKAEGVELASIKRRFREGSMAHQFGLLKVNSIHEPTNRELHDYYENHEPDFEASGRVRWQQILVKRQKGETYAVAKKRVLQLVEQLQGGADFSELARAHSEGPTKALGGNWDWTDTDSLACLELREFLSADKVGSTSDLISYKDEFHIARILERQDARRKRFEEVEAEIRDILKKADREAQARKAVRALADKAVIKTVFGGEWRFEDPRSYDRD